MKKQLFIIAIFCSNFAFGQLNSLTSTSNILTLQPNIFNVNNDDFSPTGFELGIELGYDYGELQGLNTIIENYNERHADKLLTEMPTLNRGQKFGLSSQIFLGKIFASAGFLMTAYQTNSVLNDRPNKLYRHRYHLNVQGRHFTSQLGYTFYPTKYIGFIVGGNFTLGNHRFMTETFEPTVYGSFKNAERREQPKHKVQYIGGFSRLMLGNPQFNRLSVFIEGQYKTNINQVNLQLFNEALNPNTFQNDDNENLNLRHNAVGVNVGLVVRLATLVDWWF